MVKRSDTVRVAALATTILLLVAGCGGQTTTKRFGAAVLRSGPTSTITILGNICDRTNCDELLAAAFVSLISVAGPPTSDAPVLLMIDSKKKEIQHWELTDDVAEIAIGQGGDGRPISPIDVIVKNSDPVRVEVWTTDVEQFTIDVVLRD
ncbi:MAG: hypothetical protein AB7I38_19020 [Dehalococcoidia bacterium]